MKALLFQGVESVSYGSIPDPQIIEQTDAIVKVKQCAICGSDLHPYHGREKGLDHNTAMGHEFVGEVVELGNKTSGLSNGDKVMSPFTTNCGDCYYCNIGLTARCIKSQLFGWLDNGVGLQGGQAEYVRVPDASSTLHKIPEGVSWEEGLLLGDVFSTGYYSAYQAEILPGGTYVVIGCGPVGLMAVIGALELGAEEVIAIDTIPERLMKAREFGAEVIDFQSEDPLGTILDRTEGRGADAVMEAVGQTRAARMAVDLVRPGGIISTVGVCTDEHLTFSPIEAYDKNLTFKMGRCSARHFMEKLIPVVQEKKYDISSILTHRMSLSEGVEGYKIFSSKTNNCLKVVLEP